MKPIIITVGGTDTDDPTAGQTDVMIPSLFGLDFYISAGGIGVLPYQNYTVLPSGGFRLNTALQLGDQYFIYVIGIDYGINPSGTYSNGFDFARVTQALSSRVGWLQTIGAPVLTPFNSRTKSGRYFNDGSFHSLVSLNTVKSIMEQVAPSDIDFNKYLVQSQQAIILRCLNGVFSSQEYISQGLLYQRSGFSNNDQPIKNIGKFIGIQVKTPPLISLATQVDSISLYFNEAVTFPIYVFNDSIAAPIYSVEVTTVANTQTIVDLDNVMLNHVSSSNHGGIFYIGYFQDDLGSAQAIWETNVDFKENTPYRAITVECTKTSPTTFDTKHISYRLVTNGINPHFSVFRDHTQQILKKPALFDNVLGLQMAAQVIEVLLFSQRQNGLERGLKNDMASMQASMELTGSMPIPDSPHTTGLRKQISQELIRLKQSFQPVYKSRIVNEC